MDYLWVFILPAILVGQIYLLGRRMSQPEKMLRPLSNGLTPFQEQTIAAYSDWLASNKLQYRSAFQFGVVAAVVYQQEGQPRFFSFLFHSRVTFCAESYLADLTILDTSSSGSIGLFPRPGAFAQSFPNISVEETWRRHLEGEAYLAQKFGFNWKPLTRTYDDLLLEALRIRMNYNRSQFLWPVRVLYRFFVTRNLIKNKTIAQQFP